MVTLWYVLMIFIFDFIDRMCCPLNKMTEQIVVFYQINLEQTSHKLQYRCPGLICRPVASMHSLAGACKICIHVLLSSYLIIFLYYFFIFNKNQ